MCYTSLELRLSAVLDTQYEIHFAKTIHEIYYELSDSCGKRGSRVSEEVGSS
jgi:hypothetical protein